MKWFKIAIDLSYLGALVLCIIFYDWKLFVIIFLFTIGNNIEQTLIGDKKGENK